MILTKNGFDYNFVVNLPIHLFQIVLDINNEMVTSDTNPGEMEQNPKSIGQQFPGLFKI